jgi:predicted acetyltransferase
MKVTLHAAKRNHLPVVKNLVPYYVYDMSEHLGWPCRPDGRFDGCDGIEMFWTERGKHAFVLRAGREWAGFALVRGEDGRDDVDYSIAEFFVLRKFRRKGVGERVARQLFDRFQGRWRVEYLADNAPAAEFWTKSVDRYSGGRFEKRRRKSGSGPTIALRFCSGEPAEPKSHARKAERRPAR